MGIFEWLMEGRNPAPIGKINTGIDQTKMDGFPNWAKLLVLIGGLGLWAVLFYFLFINFSQENFLLSLLFVAIYLCIALFVSPKPNMKNIGWFGGVIDNPFRWSDDVNRMILLLEFFLFPGKWLILCFRILFFWFKKQ
jgi:hypothetical protein